MGAGSRRHYRTERDIPIALQGSREDLLEPLNSDAANATVKTALNPHAAMNGFEPVVVLYERSKQEEWTRINFGVAYTFEVALDGAVLFRVSGMTPWLKSSWKNWEEFAVPETAREAVKSGRAVITIRGDWSPATGVYMAFPFDKPSAACWTGEFSMPLEVRWHPEISKGD